MQDLIHSNASETMHVAGFVALMVVLFFITGPILKWAMKQKKARISEELSTSFHLMNGVLKAMWVILSVISLSFLFVDEDEYGVLNHNFKLVLYLGVICMVTIVAANMVNHWFKKAIEHRISTQQDPTNFKFMRYVGVAIIYLTGLLFGLLAIPSLRSVAQTMLGGAGVLALVLGVSSQEALANLVGGLFIIAFKPFRVGDVVALDETMEGTVVDITLRHTVIRTWKNRMIVIPNSIINKEKLINHDMGEAKCCEYVEIGISYDSDVDLAKRIMREECEKHPFILDNRAEEEKENGLPIVKVALVELAPSSVQLRAWAWAASLGNVMQLKRDVYETIKKRFDAEGIEIPFPYRTVVMKKEK